MKRIVLLAVVLSSILCSRTWAQDRPEPRYKDKPIAYWVERLSKGATDAEQRAAADAIIAFGPDAGPAVPDLVRMLDDRSESFRSMATEVLASIRSAGKSASRKLVESLRKKTAKDPEAVIRILGAIGPDAAEAVPTLIDTLRDELLNLEAFESLCRIGVAAKSALPEMRRLIRNAPIVDGERVFPAWRLRSLALLGDDSIPVLIEFLDEKSVDFRREAASALGTFGPNAKQAVPKLRELLKSDSVAVRFESAHSLWDIAKDTAAVPVLADCLKDADHAERAAYLLGEIGPDARVALPALKAAIAEIEQRSGKESGRVTSFPAGATAAFPRTESDGYRQAMIADAIRKIEK